MAKVNLLFLFLYTLVCSSIFAQNKSNHICLTGYTGYPGFNTIRGNVFNFNNNRSIDTTMLGAEIKDNNAAICDKDGNLLFYLAVAV